MKEFAARHGWTVVQPISGDVSPRRYSRVEKAGRTAVLMDCRNEFTDRPGMAEFIRIGTWLREAGVRAPEIYEAYADDKFLLIEDLGDVSFSRALKKGVQQAELYKLAADMLAFLRELDVSGLNLPLYHDTRVHKFHSDIIEWWLPAVRGQKNPDNLAAEYLKVWDGIEAELPPARTGFLHMDYHLENLMYLPDGQGIGRCGLIDFQDASAGPVPYDLGNLLEDARVSVPREIQQDILKNCDEEFMLWYRVLTTQFHCRVIGLFTRLAVRDGRPEYLVHVPRLAAYINDALKQPLLRPLKSFFSDLGLDFNAAKDLNAGEFIQ